MSKKLSDILTQASNFAIAKNDSRMEAWINAELNGFKMSESVPEYRKYRDNFTLYESTSYSNSQILNAERIFDFISIRTSIFEIEEKLRVGIQLPINLEESQKLYFKKVCGIYSEFSIYIPFSPAVDKLFCSIKQYIFKWALTMNYIEEEKPSQYLKSNPANTLIINNINSTVESLNVANDHSSINVNDCFNKGNFRELIAKIEEIAKNISSRDEGKQILENVAEIKEELNSTKPNTNLIYKSFEWIKNSVNLIVELKELGSEMQTWIPHITRVLGFS